MSINLAVVMGRMVADPELRTTANGISTTSFTVAVERNYTKPGEEKQTDFIDVVAWRQTAEFVTKFFRKGSMIAVQGAIQVRNHEDKRGNKRKAVEIVASNVSFCGGKSEGNNSAPSSVPAAPSESVEDDDELPF